jgi:hypothetical protein
MDTYYMTLGSGQPYYPGYFECIAHNENEARHLTSEVLKGRWCGTYLSLREVNPKDRIYRGYINADGLHPDGVTWMGEL